ncbi:MAG TPA: hypothetical protein VEX86_19055 [Longimicrobium sp.]|nr:hypothetical protein [Longimicrobium sp.]
MRRSLFLLAALSLATVLPAAAQDRIASGGREGDNLYFRAEKPFARAVLPHTVDQVWQTLPEAYRRLGFAASVADSVRKELSTPNMRVRGQLYTGEANSRYFTCGRNSLAGPIADQGDITFGLLSRVETDPRGGTVILTQVNARVQRRDSSQYPVECVSTGLLENTLAQYVAEQIGTSAVQVQRRNR